MMKVLIGLALNPAADERSARCARWLFSIAAV